MKQNSLLGAVAHSLDGKIGQVQASGVNSEFVHLFIRGNYRQDILFDEVDFINAWNRLWLSANATGVEILAAQILSNHLHLCLRVYQKRVPANGWTKPGGPALSKFVHHLRMSLSIYFNRRYDVHGSLGSRRYGSAKVMSLDEDGGEDLRDLIRYINRNVTHHKVTDEYQKWPYSTFRLIFGLNCDDKIFRGEEIPDKLLRAYLPATCVLPEDFAMTSKGLIVPPSGVFPVNEIEMLFYSRTYYIKACDTPTRREGACEGERNERLLGYVSPQKVGDQDIIDFISQHSLIPIVSMNKEQIKLAIKTVSERYPRVSLRQLSRVFHVPASSIHYWNLK